MFPAVDDSSAAAMVASSFPDADAYGNGDSDDLDFPVDPNPSAAFSSAPPAAASAAPGGAPGGERRPLFQRLWTDEDEIVILRAFAEFTAQRGTSFASHQYDTTPFYEDMRRRLHTGSFTKSQLVEKIRRLKRKYRNCVDRLRVAGAAFSFRSPHEQAIFEIARTIWRPDSDKHGRDSDDEGANANGNDALAFDAATAAAANGEPANSPTSRRRRGRRRRTGDDAAETLSLPLAHMPVMTEDSLASFPQATAAVMAAAPAAMDAVLMPHTAPAAAAVDGGAISMDPAGLPAALSAAATCTAENPAILAPLFKEMVRAMLSIGGGASPLGLEPPPAIAGVPMEGDKWRQQRILELEVYLRRINLLQDQVRAALEELRSGPQARGGGGGGGMNT